MIVFFVVLSPILCPINIMQLDPNYVHVQTCYQSQSNSFKPNIFIAFPLMYAIFECKTWFFKALHNWECLYNGLIYHNQFYNKTQMPDGHSWKNKNEV